MLATERRIDQLIGAITGPLRLKLGIKEIRKLRNIPRNVRRNHGWPSEKCASPSVACQLDDGYLQAPQTAANYFRGALTRWPKSILRPEIQLQDVLAKRLEKGPLAPAKGGMTQEQADLKQANALYSLLEDRYKNKVGSFTPWRMVSLSVRG